MVIVTGREILDLVVMVVAVGFVFKDYLRVPVSDYEPLKEFRRTLFLRAGFLTRGFKDSVILTAPAVALHEIAHKAVAIGFGLEATFHAAYPWLGLGILLKVLNAPFLFFVPGYVEVHNSHLVGPLEHGLIAFAGPLTNLLLFTFAALAIRQKWFAEKYFPWLHLTKRINLFLFAFNMIPFGFFDGAQVFGSLWIIGKGFFA